MSFESLLDKEDRDRDRRERQEAERIARGEPEPVSRWTPPDPTLDAWGKPKKTKKSHRKSKSAFAKWM